MRSTIELVTQAQDFGEVWVRASHSNGPPSAASVLRRGSALVVGSGPDVDMLVREPTVSARHVRLEHRCTHLVATDLGSKNGTRLFGHAVSSAHVSPGVQLGVGAVRLEIVQGEGRRHRERFEPLPGLIGSSRVMADLAERVRRFAPLDEPVLVRGESGTGKELVARAVHETSARGRGPSAGPFVAINAASLSSELAESELFGHRRGAFTGASGDRKGAFREATGGTLFIDEIAQLGLDVQAKLLRAVEERLVRPLGGDGVVPIDVRLVAATCEPIEEYVRARRFRADLYQRIAVCVVKVPPLRERRSDIPELAAHIVAGLGDARGELRPCALRALAAVELSGNVRELRSVLLHAAIAAGPTKPIEEIHVLTALRERSFTEQRPTDEVAVETLRTCDGNVSEAARRLGLARTTLRDLLRRAKTRE